MIDLCDHCSRPGESYVYRGLHFNGLTRNRGEALCPRCLDRTLQTLHTWHPQPLPVTVQLSPVGRWMPTPASVDRSPDEPDTFVRDQWSDDPDRTTRRGMC